MKYIFLNNPNSGGGKAAPVLSSIKKAFADRGREDEVIIRSVGLEESFRVIAGEYAGEYGRDCVIITCGGDGTIHECANVLAHTETPLAVLPCGSGNDFCRKIYGNDTDLRKAAEMLGFLDGRPHFVIRSTDLGRVTLADGSSEYFIGIMSLGFDTRVEQLADKIARKTPALSSASYLLGLGICLVGEKKTYTVMTELNVRKETGNGVRTYKLRRKLAYTLIAVCNSSYYGGGFCPAPDAKLNDGLFEVCVASPCNFAEICNLAPMYKMGVAADISPKVNLITSTGGRFFNTDGRKFTVNLDGENRSTDSVSFSVDNKAIRLCTVDGYNE